MKQTKLFFCPALRHFSRFIGIFAAIMYSSLAHGQSTSGCPDQTGWYTCMLTSTNSYTTNTIYDDGSWNHSGGFSNGDTSSGTTGCMPWNCGNTFLNLAYTGTDDTLTFTFGSHWNPTWSQMHNIIIVNTTTGAVILNTFLGIGVPRAGVIPDSSSYVFNTSIPGEYFIRYFRPGVDTTGAPDITGLVVFIKQVQKIWIDASPICSDFSDTQYLFQVHAYPEFSTVMVQAGNWAPMTNCDFTHQQLAFGFNFTGIAGAVNHGTWITVNSLGGATSGNSISGTAWDSAVVAMEDDMNHFWISNNAIDSIHSPTNLACYLPGGDSAGKSLIINLSWSDGLETINVSAPLIIKYPAASGAASSYDLSNYTVSGTETWTPTNNPVTIAQSNEITRDTIRIQDTLTINPGGILNIESGLRVEFGPGGHLVVQNNTTSGTEGGFLSVGSSTLTAYRGCDGTDSSTWGGIVLTGDPALPQGPSSWGAPGHPQGKIYLDNSEISYADIGLQNGTLSANSGGLIYSIGGNTFYNNKEAVKLWPYRNFSGTTEITSTENLRGCTFINDNNAWFPSADFINATGIGTVNLTQCTFTNNTGRDIASAVTGLDAGMLIGNSNFNKFLTGVTASYTSATHGLTVTGCTFTNNKWGVSINGAISPSITGNSFNLSDYTGYGPTYDYSGSSVVVVNDQNIGVLVSGTSAYNLTNNSFQIAGYSGSGYIPYTTGTIEFNTGCDPNMVTDNTFTGVGVAMMSNFTNANTLSLSGLTYTCNTDHHVGYDIAVLGYNTSPTGINLIQYTSTSTSGVLPAGNKFSGANNLFNQQSPFYYFYDNTDPVQYPSVIGGPSTVTTSGIASSPSCYTPPGYGDIITTTGLGTLSATQKYVLSGTIINHYMNDTTGIPYRDSIYFWAAQLGSPYGDLLTANLLVEDNQPDSAYVVYDSIITKYGLDSNSVEGNDFVQGRNLLSLLVYKHTYNEPLLTLSPAQLSTLHSVKTNATMWAHVRAEGWLQAFNHEPFTDTFLYPKDTGSVGERHAAPAQPSKPITAIHANKVYPNPVTGILNVFYTSKSGDLSQINIEDISGRVLITQPLQSGILTGIDVSFLSPGIYIYRIFEGKDAMMVGKVVKE